MKLIAIVLAQFFVLSASAANIEWTYMQEDYVIASQRVDTSECEVGSCGAYIYYNAMIELEKAVRDECECRGFRDVTIIGKDQDLNDPQVWRMEGICKEKIDIVPTGSCGAW